MSEVDDEPMEKPGEEWVFERTKMKSYSTDELMKWAKNLCTWDMVSDTLIRDAIIAKLRAADKLCEAAKGAWPDMSRHNWNSRYQRVYEAIAEYEEGK